MVKWNAILKWVMYSLMLIIFFLLETAILTRVKIFDVHPYLLPLIAAITAVFEGPLAGAGFGFAAGMLYDAFIPPAEGFYSIIFLISCYAIGFVCRSIFRKNMLTAFIWSLALTTFTQFIYFFLFFFLPAKTGPMALLTIFLPEVCFSVLFTPVIYFAVKSIRLRFEGDD